MAKRLAVRKRLIKVLVIMTSLFWSLPAYRKIAKGEEKKNLPAIFNSADTRSTRCKGTAELL